MSALKYRIATSRACIALKMCMSYSNSIGIVRMFKLFSKFALEVVELWGPVFRNVNAWHTLKNEVRDLFLGHTETMFTAIQYKHLVYFLK